MQKLPYGLVPLQSRPSFKSFHAKHRTLMISTLTSQQQTSTDVLVSL